MSATELVRAAEAAQDPLEDFSPDVIATAGQWKPRTIRDVEWALECIGESEAEVAAVEAQLADVIARAKVRAAHIREAANRRANFFRTVVQDFANQNRADLLVGKKKSRDFIAGRIGWRKHGGRLRVEDKDALGEWLEGQDASLYRVEVKPEMSALQAHARDTGEIPPGCVWEEEHDELYVEATPLMLPQETP